MRPSPHVPLLGALLGALAFIPAASAQGSAAHVHGLARLEVVVEGGTISLHLESPLEALLGFEHAPRDAGERTKVEVMRKNLAQGERMFSPTPAARCRLVSARLTSPILDAAPGKPSARGREAHDDLDAEFQFQCAQPARITGLEVRLGEFFPRLQRIDAQVVSPKGQSASRLDAKRRFLSW